MIIEEDLNFWKTAIFWTLVAKTIISLLALLHAYLTREKFHTKVISLNDDPKHKTTSVFESNYDLNEYY